MDNNISIQNCQICGNNQFSQHISCIDYTVSRETFKIVKCNSCGFVFTNPRPNENEIGKYYSSDLYISHSATKKGLINALYHIIRKRTLKSKLNLLNSLKTPTKELLDIGTGTADFLNYMVQNAYSGIGIEPDNSTREMATKKYGLKILEAVNFYQLQAMTYDYVTMWHVLEHVSDLEGYATNIKRILKDDGYLIIAVPNHESVDGKHYKEKWAAYDVPRHLSHFSVGTMEKYLSKHGFKIVQKRPMPYDGFYVSMLSEKNAYKNGAIGILKGFYWGLLTLFQGYINIKNYSSIIYIAQKE